jgi:ABC-2 type transport system permease protein
MTGLVRAELLKVRTTKTWWLVGLGILGATALALAYNCIFAHIYLHQGISIPPGTSPQQAEEIRRELAARRDVAGQAANIYTSGQYFGLLLTMLLGMLVVTNEYFHQTATTTFLVTPRRTRVIVAKFLATLACGAAFWLLALVPSVITGVIFLRAENFAVHLGDWPVWRSVLLNLAAYLIWAVFGVGLGVLIRSQIGAVVTGTVLYLIGTALAQGVFLLIRTFLIKREWVLTAQVIVPSIASQVMTSVIKLYPQSPPQWVGAAVLVGYGLIAGTIGVFITRRRDIS